MTDSVVITRAELAALVHVLSTQVQRPVYEPNRQIRGETAAIEAFLDRAIAAAREPATGTPKGVDGLGADTERDEGG